MPQIARPTTDITDGAWTPNTGGTNLAIVIDEVTADITDYIQSGGDPGGDTAEIAFGSLTDPVSSTGHVIRYQIGRDGPGLIDITVKLMQGAVEIAAWTHTSVSATPTTYARTLTTAQADAITNYADLRLRQTATPRTVIDAAALDPASLSPLLWFKADAITGKVDLDPISQWDDSSGNARHATQVTGTKQPTYRTNVWNGKPTLRFDGGDGLATAAVDLSTIQVMTWYMVASATDLTLQMLMELSDNANTVTGAAYALTDASSRMELATKGNAGFNTWTSLNTFENGTGRATVLHGIFDMRTATHHETQGGIDGDTVGNRGSTNTNTGNFANAPFNVGCRDADASTAATAMFLTGDIAEIIVYSARHTAAQRWGIERWLAEKWGVTAWSKPLSNIVWEGDSITEGGNTYFSDSWPDRLLNRLKDKIAWRNPAISGETIDQGNADFATQLEPESAVVNFGPKNIATVWMGTNDMVSVGGNQTAAATLTEYYAYLDTVRAAGFSTIAFTVIPRDDTAAPADMETKRLAFNTDVVANYAAHADALCNPTTDTRFDAEADALNTTYYNADVVHPNTLGLRILSGFVGDTLESAFGVEEIVPTDISGLALWLDASAITGKVDGDPISQWDDGSGNARHASQATGTKQPTYKTGIINGLPIVRLDGGDALATAAIDLTAAAGITVLVVATTAVTSTQLIAETSANYNNVADAFALSNAATVSLSAKGASAYATGDSGGFLAEARVRSFTIDRAKASREAIAWANAVKTGNSTTGALTGTFGNHVLNIGGRAGTSLFFTGDIAELMIFNRVLTGGERGRLEEYLAYKWGSF